MRIFVTFFQGLPFAACLGSSSTRSASDSTDLKEVFAKKYPEHAEVVKAFRKAHGNTKVGEVTVEMVRKRRLNLTPPRKGSTSIIATFFSDVRRDEGHQGLGDGDQRVGPRRGHPVQGVHHPRVPGAAAQGPRRFVRLVPYLLLIVIPFFCHVMSNTFPLIT